MKDHRNLLIAFYAFLPAEAKITIPHEAEQPPPEPEQPTPSDALDFSKKVQEAFCDEPAKYEEFLKLLSDCRAHRVDLTSTIARAEQPPAPDNNKRKRAGSFMSKLKTRFQSIDPHVYKSFREILKMYLEVNKPTYEVYEEVVTFLEGNDDLVMKLSDFFNGPSSISAPTRDS
ncbi:unnamed protein product [Arabis nemorensis]|uniref:Histone deacetylase interacting domain-containing protein n=1 Tax=Arabis nemorensis TaxID=586526 RepID=A0A565AZ78_9BRAS|nr:unnamed protein product [Arabis nemorensis]